MRVAISGGTGGSHFKGTDSGAVSGGLGFGRSSPIVMCSLSRSREGLVEAYLGGMVVRVVRGAQALLPVVLGRVVVGKEVFVFRSPYASLRAVNVPSLAYTPMLAHGHHSKLRSG